ncbi:MAG: hypothetical protein NWE77_07965 [Candidatus Bathyarchaeota archaeon]|jgi:hypothetical protein|nr:hypothetical protein [Candidatus Bathyarchaeota archaeon]UCC27683.1 MAG: hypothetical protein JSW29_06385 [Candidatus Bathyarchaeota archaeon]
MLGKTIQLDEKPEFQIFFLRDDDEQSVEVQEVEKIDYEEVKKRVEHGESVFITRKSKEKSTRSLVEEESTVDLWYFSHS